ARGVTQVWALRPAENPSKIWRKYRNFYNISFFLRPLKAVLQGSGEGRLPHHLVDNQLLSSPAPRSLQRPGALLCCQNRQKDFSVQAGIFLL
ncbi:hypothetical protein, partial [Colidextribacter sp. OB.20]|uniref:hypothetical protein n=1 Tax=Colidextribacter sp. OB.20 TaxID=2304568 RepID=UPI001A9BBDC4